jgi:spore germination protein GerM
VTAHRARRGLVLVVVVALLAALGACGVAENDEPHVIAANEVPPGLLDAGPSTSTSVASPTVQAVTVYYVIQEGEAVRLQGVTREVERADRARDRLVALLTPPTAEEARAGITSSIPPDTELLETELNEADNELVIDLSDSLFDIQGQGLRNAFAQLVWTATELPGVERVRFRADGEEFRAPDEEGVEQPGAVSRSDYITLAPGQA